MGRDSRSRVDHGWPQAGARRAARAEVVRRAGKRMRARVAKRLLKYYYYSSVYLHN